MVPGAKSTGSTNLTDAPDGRQTRIDFFSSGRGTKKAAHVTRTRRSSFEWLQVLTGWIRSSNTEQEHQLEEFRQFLLKRKYSNKTCQSYIFMLKKFFAYIDEKGITDIGPGTIEDYNYDFFVRGKYSRSYQLQFINSLTLYFEFAENVKVNFKGLRKADNPRR